MAENVKDLQAELSKTHELSSRVARSTIAVIDTVVQRGGFKGEELSTIGQLRDQAVQAIQSAEAYAAENLVKTPEK
jgi:hypothetical protein